jgi:heterotetrameric sarcosine oxidase delta subunit
MILIPCPHCGPRNSSEFAHAGERRPRPDPNAATPAEWRAYLYDKRNPAGWTGETWYHRFGCRKFVAVERHTVTGEVRRAEPAGAAARGGDPPGGAGDHGGAASAPAGGRP